MRNDGGCVTRNRARLVTLTNTREDLALFFFFFPHLSPFLLTQTRPEQNSVPVPCTDALAAASQLLTAAAGGSLSFLRTAAVAMSATLRVM